MATHDVGVVAHMCDRVGVMREGCLVEEVSRDALIAGEVSHSYTRELREAALVAG